MSLLEEDVSIDKAPAGKRFAFVAAAAVATGGLVLLALVLGSWAFAHREGTLHVGRLERLVEKHPKGADVRAGLEAEGSRFLGEAAGASELTELARRTTPDSEAAVLNAGPAAARTRAFQSGSYVYWLFFDAEDVLTAFVVVKAPGP
jgi:hypothetical protein